MQGQRVLPVLLALVLLAGCGSSATAARIEDDSAQVGVGEQLQVDLGGENPSVGYEWYLIGKPDEKVLSDHGKEITDPGDDGQGSSSRVAWVFEGVAAGSTTVTFQRCYRSAPPDCDTEERLTTRPIEFTVEVE